MIILPVYKNDVVVGYSTGSLYINHKGRQLFVSDGYEASTIADVCKLAYLNAKVREWRADIALRFSVRDRVLQLES